MGINLKKWNPLHIRERIKFLGAKAEKETKIEADHIKLNKNLNWSTTWFSLLLTSKSLLRAHRLKPKNKIKTSSIKTTKQII